MAPAALSSGILRPVPSPLVGIGHSSLLSGIIENLPAGGANAALGRELRSLDRERDPELLAEGLLNLAARQMQAGRAESAARVFPALHRLAENTSVPETLRRRISGQLAAFQGQGNVGQKVEHHLQNFFHEAMHPATLAGFAFGAGAFQGARLLALSRLGVAPAGFFTRGFGARFAGGVAGWAAEVPALTFGSRGVRALMGERLEWSRQSVGRELASTAITLGLMRAAGYGARRALETVHGLPAASQSLRWSGAVPFSGPALQQSAMLGSLMLAHDFEARLGLRPASDLAGNFSESLLTLLHFNVAGRIFHEVQPRAFARAIQAAESRSQDLSGPRFSWPRLEIAPRVAAGFAISGKSWRPEPIQVSMMGELPKHRPLSDPRAAGEARPQSSIAEAPFKFRNMMEDLADPIMVTDMVGRLIYMNRMARELVEQTPLEWLEGRISDYFRPLEGEEGIFAFSRRGKDVGYWNIRSQPIEGSEGYQMHHFSDRTELRQLQETAGLAELRASLAEGLVHDVGNMVASAYLHERNIENMLERSEPVSERPPVHDRATIPPGAPSRFQATGRFSDSESPISFRSSMATLLSGIRELGDLLSNTVETFRESRQMLSGRSDVRLIPIQPLLEKALRYNESMRERSGIKLVTDFSQEPPIMFGEQGPLMSAILNLCINACHAMPNGGFLRVRTSANNGLVTIEVEDTGTGIAPENLPHIFEPHFTTKEHSGGTGMGLANVHLVVVRVHRGKIEVESELGRGTTFRLILPQVRRR
ncbi:MAG TPA: ATP-binding protein [bacterium]|nr:ATP-binding protein [bacterium]